LRDKQNSITHLLLSRTRHDNKVKKGKPITLDLSFNIDGNIREVFNPKMWEAAYDKHDNLFRMSITVALKLGRRMISVTKITRKASMFWTRSPKIPSRIWVLIITDDVPLYPITIEEAKSLLFDVNKLIEVETNDFKLGNHTIYADIAVSWGRHYYTEPTEINIDSNVIDFYIED
jgi:hypothetical protein